jgi:hypothetical protein
MLFVPAGARKEWRREGAHRPASGGGHALPLALLDGADCSMRLVSILNLLSPGVKDAAPGGRAGCADAAGGAAPGGLAQSGAGQGQVRQAATRSGVVRQ